MTNFTGSVVDRGAHEELRLATEKEAKRIWLFRVQQQAFQRLMDEDRKWWNHPIKQSNDPLQDS